MGGEKGEYNRDMKIVKFKDGTYGIRKGFRLLGWVEYWYRDLVSQRLCLWWRTGSGYFKDCKGTKDAVLGYLNKPPVDYGTPITLEQLRKEK